MPKFRTKNYVYKDKLTVAGEISVVATVDYKKEVKRLAFERKQSISALVRECLEACHPHLRHFRTKKKSFAGVEKTSDTLCG